MQENTRQTEFAGLSGDIEGIADSRAPIVLLHGLTYDRTTWRPVLAELRRLDPGRRVLALDLPGHGRSPTRESHRMADSVDAVHRAVRAAALDAPVVVGHSMSGGIASLYAAEHPSRGVVNVDSPPPIASFAAMIRANAEQLRGPAFPMIWESITAGFHLELLPPQAQETVRAAARLDQTLTLSYWQDFFEVSPPDLDAMVADGAAVLRKLGMPYLLVLGSALDPAARRWIADEMPAAVIETWSNTGHFPHLAHPAAFARLLADTGSWQAGV